MIIGIASVKYSLKNIAQRRSRSFSTILSIFIGLTTIFIFVSFGWGLYNYIGELSSSSSADKLLIQVKGGFGSPDTAFTLTDDDLDSVKGVAGVYSATGSYFKAVEAEFNDEKLYTLIGSYDPKVPLVMDVFGISTIEGRMLRTGDDKDVLLGYNYQIKDKIFSRPVSVNDKIEINGIKFRAVGFLEEIGNPQDDSQIYITNDYYEEMFSQENLSYYWIIAQVDLENIEDVKIRVEKALRKERGLEEGKEDFFVQTFDELIEGYSSALDIVIGFVILIALISVLVSAINTANTMITSVLERVKEIGVIKSIGAKNSEIFGIFLFESSFLGFVAGVIGVLLGWGLSSLGGAILDNLGYGFLQPYFSPWLFIGCISFATITGGLSGIIPAVNASRTNPVDALRYE